MIELLKKIAKSGLSCNQFLLCHIVENQKELSLITRTQLLSKLTLKDYQNTIELGYIKMKEPQKYILENLEITEKFRTFVEGKKSRGDLDEWFEEWYNLFPKGVKSGGYNVKTNPTKCRKNLKRYIREHPKTDVDTIIKATKLYIEEFALKGFSYIKLAPYFVYKDSLSTLEDYCEKISSNEEEDDIIGVKERQI